MKLLGAGGVRLCLLLSFGLGLLLTSGLLADQKSFVSFESQIFRHEQALAVASRSLEEWLSGRLDQKAFLNQLDVQKKSFGALPGSTGTAIRKSELDMLDSMGSFARSQQPTADGQRKLFLTLGELNCRRSEEYLQWRERELKGLLASKLPIGAKDYFAWEAAWNPIWLEEARLTRRLQQGMLSGSASGEESKKVLQGLLKLSERGAKIKAPGTARELQTLALDRVAVLARTAEQLIRLESRQSRSALTQVRRLSRKLSSVTEEFQGKRLQIIQSLN